MIRSLTGSVTHHTPTGIILELNGVGYLVAAPLRALPPIGTIVTLFTHHHVRENEQALYGFTSLTDLTAFESLLVVSGIGPKSALAVLSIATAETLERAIEADDVAFFASVPGIGKKTAAKIIVELKGKLVGSGATGSHELRDALAALGYPPRDLNPVLQQLPSDLTDTQDQLRWILRQLGKR